MDRERKIVFYHDCEGWHDNLMDTINYLYNKGLPFTSYENVENIGRQGNHSATVIKLL
jgi:hypothetical protein